MDSKSDAGAGSGAVFLDLFPGDVLPSVMSVFTDKLLAILYALQVTITLPHSPFTNFSDSSRALQVLSNLNSPHSLMLAILEWLVLLGRRSHTYILLGPSRCWCQGE